LQRFRHVRMPLITRRWYDIPLRASMVAALVATVVTLSGWVGPAITGILALFPVVFTSLMLILHPRIGGPATAAVIANSAWGLMGFGLAIAVLHLAALRFHEDSQELAAFVLHFHGAVEEHRMGVERRFLAKPHAERRVARGRRGDAVVVEAVEHALQRRLHRVHAKVEGSRVLEASGESKDLALGEAGSKTREDPVGKVRAQFEGEGIEVLGLQLREPLALVALQRRFDLAHADALQLHEGGERDLARHRARRHVLEHAPSTQRRVDRIGHERAVALAQALVVAEELAQLRVGGSPRREDHGERFDDRVELRAGKVHAAIG